MAGIYIYSENSSLAKQLVTAASALKASLNEPVVVVTTDAAPEGFAAAGVDKLVALKGAGAPESFVSAIADTVKEASVVLFGATSRGKDIASKVASKLGASLVSEAQSLSIEGGALVTTRMTYGGLAMNTEKSVFPALATIPSRSYEEAAAGAAAETVTVDAAADSRVTVVSTSPIEHEGVDITEAERLVSVGRGLAKVEDMAMVKELASALNAEVACSRSIAEDYHWLPVETYVGISGQKVKPELYFAIGISGQIQHIAGMRDSKVIVAIDTNDKAPIFEAADYGIVGDMYEVVPKLIAALK